MELAESRVRLDYPPKLFAAGQFKPALISVPQLAKEIARTRIIFVFVATEESAGSIEYVNFN